MQFNGIFFALCVEIVQFFSFPRDDYTSEEEFHAQIDLISLIFVLLCNVADAAY
jgi:hypothetical protein